MTRKAQVHACELCGERDGRVQKVVVQVAGRKLMHRWLCLHCRAALIIRLFEKEARR